MIIQLLNVGMGPHRPDVAPRHWIEAGTGLLLPRGLQVEYYVDISDGEPSPHLDLVRAGRRYAWQVEVGGWLEAGRAFGIDVMPIAVRFNGDIPIAIYLECLTADADQRRGRWL